MLSAAEASIEAAAENDAERQRLRAKLYAPPAGYQRTDRRRAAAAASRMDKGRARDLMAQLAAEDARLMGGRPT